LPQPCTQVEDAQTHTKIFYNSTNAATTNDAAIIPVVAGIA
jgi:hypothetical protein